MGRILLDTHAWVWSFTAAAALSPRARAAISKAEAVLVSPISFFEIGQKARLGKWPEMLPHLAGLERILAGQGAQVAPLTPEICLEASLMDWAHRDPFDRLIAATASVGGWPLVTRDPAFAALPAVATVW